MALCRVMGSLEQVVRRNVPAGQSVKEKVRDGEGVEAV